MSANPSTEMRLLVRDTSWEHYRALCASLQYPTMHLTYRAGLLEVTRPSQRHELRRTNLARLVAVHASLHDIALYSYSSRTFTDEAASCGVDPDECFALGLPIEDVPDIAVEVLESADAIDKLAVYATLGVPEVWFFEYGSITVHMLDLPTRRYRRRERSWFLPELDLDVAARLALRPDTPRVLRELEQALATT